MRYYIPALQNSHKIFIYNPEYDRWQLLLKQKAMVAGKLLFSVHAMQTGPTT